ncbi:hypothetical protein ABIE26_002963 [Pedobacter africanus]
MKAFLILIILLVSAVCAISFRSIPLKVTGQLWKLTNSDYPYSPWMYERIYSIISCPLEGKVCFLDIQTSDLIPAGQPYAGQPNVIDDIFTTFDLADQITDATANSLNDPYVGTNSRIIYERH